MSHLQKYRRAHRLFNDKDIIAFGVGGLIFALVMLGFFLQLVWIVQQILKGNH